MTEMLTNESLNKMVEDSIKKYWDYPALSNYNGYTLHYRDLARRIEKIHIMFERCGLNCGDKVAICARNQANWAVSLLATLTYGAVAVPLLHEFKAGNIQYLVNHSDSRILFVGDLIWENLSTLDMPNLKAVINITDFSLFYWGDEQISEMRDHLNELFGKKYPKHFGRESVSYYQDSLDTLAMINYTSGTTGFSKGVMLSYRNLVSNILFAKKVMPEISDGARVVSILPSAHMYGMMFELLYEMTGGCHVYFLTRLPTPRMIAEAFSKIQPNVIISVPMIIEKIYKKQLQPIINKRSIRLLLRVPVIEHQLRKRILAELVNVFGGQFSQVIIGGAPFNKEAEPFFKRIGFPFTVGYGLTECGPIACYANWKEHKLFSAGRPAPRMQVRIDSSDPQNQAGEILLKGDNVMLGYYKNEDATRSCFTDDGWFRTGDMGIIDQDGFLFIRGRCKNMILGANGQNIYPEEIESMIDNMPYVTESLVIEENGNLVALVYPDYQMAQTDGLSEQELKNEMEQMRNQVNAEQPRYCNISEVRIYPEEFEKTPKRSIKRYLYNNNNNG